MERALLVFVHLEEDTDTEQAREELKALALACEMEPVALIE